MSSLRVGIHGAAGRMGKRLVALGHEDAEITIAAAIDNERHPDFGKDAGSVAGIGEIGIPISDCNLEFNLDAVIDFSVPEAVDGILDACLNQSVPLVVATTGYQPSFVDRLNQAALRIPIVFSPSMSLAANIAMKLTSVAGEALQDYAPGVDAEVIERHHRFKEDAPSGTALRFGSLIAEQLGQSQHVHGRSGRPGQRPRHEIGYHALRTGDNPGEHTIVFGMMGETLEITVKATNRDCYALGALAAAKFVAKQQPGIYNMYNVLGI